MLATYWLANVEHTICFSPFVKRESTDDAENISNTLSAEQEDPALV